MGKYNMRKFKNNKNFMSVLPNRVNLNANKNKDKKEVLLSYLEKTRLINYNNDGNKHDMLKRIIDILKEYIRNDELTIDKYIEVRSALVAIDSEQITNYKDLIIDILINKNYEMIGIIKEIDRSYFSFVNRVASKISSDIRDCDIIKDLLGSGLKDVLIDLYDEVFARLKDNEITNKIFEINKNNLENLFLRLIFLNFREYKKDKVSINPYYTNIKDKTKERTKKNWV